MALFVLKNSMNNFIFKSKCASKVNYGEKIYNSGEKKKGFGRNIYIKSTKLHIRYIKLEKDCGV